MDLVIFFIILYFVIYFAVKHAIDSSAIGQSIKMRDQTKEEFISVSDEEIENELKK